MTRYIKSPIRLAHRIYESTVGPSDRVLPPVIFMHGMLCSKEIWDIIPQRVADRTRRKVYTYDARNHGESEWTRDYTFEDNVKDLHHFMDQMRIKKSVLVGHGMGGITAISAALNTPAKVDKTFIVDMYVRKIEPELINESIYFLTTWAEIVSKLPVDTPSTEVTRISVKLLYERLPPEMRWNSEMEGYLLSRFLYLQRPDGGYEVPFNERSLVGALFHYRDAPIVYPEPQNLLTESPTLRNLTGHTEEAPEHHCIPRIAHNGQFEGKAYFIYGGKSPFYVEDEKDDIKRYFPLAEMIEFKKASHHLFADYPERFTDVLVEKLNQY